MLSVNFTHFLITESQSNMIDMSSLKGRNDLSVLKIKDDISLIKRSSVSASKYQNFFVKYNPDGKPKYTEIYGFNDLNDEKAEKITLKNMTTESESENIVDDDKVFEPELITEGDVVDKEYLEKSPLQFVNVRRQEEKSMIRRRWNKALKFSEFVVNRNITGGGYNIVYGTNDLNGNEFHLIYQSDNQEVDSFSNRNENSNVDEKFASKKQARYFYAKAKDSKKWAKMAKEYSKDTDWKNLPEQIDENHDGGKFSLVEYIIAYENDELSFLGTIELFSNLIRTGQAFSLQGHYSRTAESFIDNGLIDEKTGKINKENLIEFIEENNIELEENESIDNLFKNEITENKDNDSDVNEATSSEDNDEYNVEFIYRGKNGLLIYKEGDFYSVLFKDYSKSDDDIDYDKYDETFGMYSLGTFSSLEDAKKELNLWKNISNDLIMKKLSEEKFEFVQVNSNDEENSFKHSEINLNDYTDKQKEIVASHKFDDLETLKSICGEKKWKEVLAELIFDSEQI